MTNRCAAGEPIRAGRHCQRCGAKQSEQCPHAPAAPTFRIEPIELLALRKLLLVSRALAKKLGGMAGVEQNALAQCLADVLDRYEIEVAAHEHREAERS